MTAKFAHLHLHSEYSLANSVIRIPALVTKAIELGMPTIALTDQANIYGYVKFYKAALNAGIKPVVGVDTWIEQEQNLNSPTRLTFLVKDQVGYRNLCILLARAHREAQHNSKACIRKSWLHEFGDGLIVLSGAQDGDLGLALTQMTRDRAHQLLDEYCDLFGDRFYIELRRIGKAQEEEYITDAVELAAQRGLPVVATNAVHFLSPDDFQIHEIRVCIHDGRILNDKRRPKAFTDQQYLRSSEEMVDLFRDIPEAVDNTLEIAKRCNFVMEMGNYYLPKFQANEHKGVDEILVEEARKGLEQRMDEHSNAANEMDLYRDRLNTEIEIIIQMGFAGYFLIVADFINWAKTHGIPVGPGRGSGAGSLVAWALGITELDPIQHGLLFERFLNPERVSLPDFDIDFCMEGRDRVIDYVAERYGRDKVSQIVTHGTMAARAVVRDVGRVLGMPYGFVDQVAKLIPFEVGMTLGKALKEEDLLADRYNKEADIKELLDIARGLEGLARNVGKHAGGVVIAPSDLTDFTSLYCEQGNDQMVTQFDKDDLEAIGLVKFDFLGLRTLTIIDWAVANINSQMDNGQKLSLKDLPMDDKETFALLKTCKTTALFQLESRGMKDLIQRLQPDSFDDLVALVALYRPGPLQSGMVEDFIDRKYGRASITYAHPLLEQILKPTYGVILYQEQVMEIAKVLAGYSLGSADLLRSAMGKKKPKEMAKQRQIFLEGAEKNNIDEKTGTFIFNLMEKFAGYGFNKSHSAAYAMITYQTAWLKAHHPANFMAASLSADMEHTDRVVTLIAECRDMNLEVLRPSINTCQYFFEAITETEITYGLGAIKGLGFGVIEAIVQARENSGKFTDLFDFCTRVDNKRINKRALESLIQAGAMDDLGSHRASLIATLPVAIDLASQKTQNQQTGQSDFFGVEASHSDSTAYVPAPEWSKEQTLTAEKETLGIYLSGHPIDGFRRELDQIVHARLADVNPDRDRSMIVAGLVVGLRTMNTRRGERMAFVTLDDQTARVELAVFSDLYSQCREVVRKDNLLVVHGQVSVDEYTGGYKMSAESIYSLEQARAFFADKLIITVEKSNADLSVIDRLAETLKKEPQGQCQILFHYRTDQVETQISTGEDRSVSLSSTLLGAVKNIVGDDNVNIIYRKIPGPMMIDKVDSAA